MMARRYKLTLEYDGGPFVGWQRQDNGPSVQAALEDAVFAFCGERARVYSAGRTDAGVHAAGQVAHVDLARATTPDEVRNALNHHLRPAPIVVLDAAAATDAFDARHSAIRRTYRYRILNRRTGPALARGQVWWQAAPLDTAAMAAAAAALKGRHDFTTFRAAICQAKSPVKTLDQLDVARAGDEVVITAVARSFLHHQVRNMVGTLALVGHGKWQIGDVRDALAARDRAAGGPTAPADGLCLVQVDYP